MSQFKTAVGLTEITAVNSALAKRVELCVFCIAGMYQRLPTEQAAFSSLAPSPKTNAALI